VVGGALVSDDLRSSVQRLRSCCFLRGEASVCARPIHASGGRPTGASSRRRRLRPQLARSEIQGAIRSPAESHWSVPVLWTPDRLRRKGAEGRYSCLGPGRRIRRTSARRGRARACRDVDPRSSVLAGQHEQRNLSRGLGLEFGEGRRRRDQLRPQLGAGGAIQLFRQCRERFGADLDFDPGVGLEVVLPAWVGGRSGI
jgi:hypothetical protein